MRFDVEPKKWTMGAKFCYRRGCTCQGCYVKDIMETGCFMKMAVFKLVQKFGAPTEENFTPAQQEVIDAIRDGAKTKEQIATMINKTTCSIQGLLPDLYEIARAEGFRPTNPRHILPEYIEWVKENY